MYHPTSITLLNNTDDNDELNGMRNFNFLFYKWNDLIAKWKIHYNMLQKYNIYTVFEKSGNSRIFKKYGILEKNVSNKSCLV